MRPLRDLRDKFRLLNGLRRIWHNYKKITPKMVVDSLKLIWKFIGGLCLFSLIWAVCWYFDPCGIYEPTQVLAAPTYELLDPRPEHSLLQGTRDLYHVRITVGDGSGGSGTLVRPDAVATCEHLFRDSTSNIRVHFADGTSVPAYLLYSIRTYDMALLVLAPVDYEPAKISGSKDLKTLTIAGYGRGDFQESSGKFVEWKRPTVAASAPSTAVIGVSARSGDSGGGIFNDDGLYGIIWGSVDGETYGTCGAGFRQFIREAFVKLEQRPDRLVVVSMPLSECPPCQFMAEIVHGLQEAGYDAEHVQHDQYVGPPARQYPTLFFYAGERLVLQKVGVAEYNWLTANMKRKSHVESQPGIGR